MTETTETTETTPKPHNAKDILIEAMDTVRATYWIQGQEANFATGFYLGAGSWDWGTWEEVKKAIPAVVDDTFNIGDGAKGPEGKAKVTGVCSIGALALANVTLYDEPLAPWSHISERDFETWKAGQALAQEIIASDHYFLHEPDAGSVIATWNDNDERTREQVLAMFEKASKSPLLEAETVYMIGYDPGWGFCSSHLFFASEEAAQEFINTPSTLLEQVKGNASNYDLIVEPYQHDSEVTV